MLALSYIARQVHVMHEIILWTINVLRIMPRKNIHILLWKYDIVKYKFYYFLIHIYPFYRCTYTCQWKETVLLM